KRAVRASESAATQMKECAMKDRIRDLIGRGGAALRPRRGAVTGARGPRRRAVTATVAAVALAVATLASVSATASTAATATATTTAATSVRAAYLDRGLPVPTRVADLLGRMTLPEKIGQMVQIEATEVTDKTSACTSTGGFNL